MPMLSKALLFTSAITVTLILQGCGGGYGWDGPGDVDGFRCESKLDLGPVAMASRKGLTLDDTTHQWCDDKILSYFPNTNERVLSLRMFKAWQSDWAEENKMRSWQNIAAFVKRNNAQVLVGSQITCNEADDDRDWQNVLQLLKMLGREHIMGVAIGNELELLSGKKGVSAQCVTNLWSGGYLYRKFVARAHDLDTNGLQGVKLTSVFGGKILGGPGNPFLEDPAVALVTTFLRNVTEQFRSQFVFSLNVYPYFDPSAVLDPGGNSKCSKALAKALTFSTKDPMHNTFTAQVKTMRDRMKQMTGRSDDILWITETGWSFPKASTLGQPMDGCPDWSSESSFREYYKSFLSWDLRMGDGSKGPDYIFYFTMRDSVNFGFIESFGLLENVAVDKLCQTVSCKLQNNDRSGHAARNQTIVV